MVLANACGPCIGQWKRDDIEKGESNSIITSYNRNFPPQRRQPGDAVLHREPRDRRRLRAGRSLSIRSRSRDEIEGEDGTRFKLEPPAPAPEVPLAEGFVIELRLGTKAPPGRARRRSRSRCRPTASGCSSSSPSPPGTAATSSELPLLLKAKGKCTTDHISPAGPWLRFRGHLDNISDNMFTGAVNAFTDEPGKGLDLLSGERGQAVLGRRAPLQGRGPALGSSSATRTTAAPGRPVEVVFHHEDGSEDRVETRHSLNEEQVAWFRAGSALNLLRAG